MSDSDSKHDIHEPLQAAAFDPSRRESISSESLPADGEVIKAAGFVPLQGPLKRRNKRLGPLHYYSGAAFVLLLMTAIFLFTAKSVTITTEPADADLSIRGGIVVSVGGNRLMHTGEYQLYAQADGYKDLQRQITVGEEQNQNLRVELEKLPGIITVKTPRDADAVVKLDGEVLGKANQAIADVKAGEYQLQVESERYLPYSQSIEVLGLGKSQTIEADLQPAWAEVSISSEPAGAELMVDGEVQGSTPLIAKILRGERELRLRLPGHKSWQDIREFKAGEVLELSTVELAKADGLVKVDSRPSRASITVDGEYLGQTPLEVALAPGKNYQLTLFKDGFQPAQKQLRVASGENEEVAVDLQPKLGQVKVNAKPADALLYVDGRLMGRANQVLILPAAQTTITVKKEGYADYQTTVLPRPSFDQSLAIQLKTVDEVRWENIKERITSAAGQQLKLFKPNATFSMGSSRREQGRRANEVLHEVKLTRPFYLSLHEVTNAQFRQFRSQHTSNHAKGNSLDSDNFPVVNVTWQQAALYCNWLSERENLPVFYQVENGAVTGFNAQATGYRMPTEAEWAWAARFENGNMLKFAWPGELPPPDKFANIADRNAAPVAGYIQPAYNDGFIVSAPVGSFPPNGKGLFDLAGNAAEWVNDFYEIPDGLSNQATEDPLGPSNGMYHVIRGSSWAHGSLTELRLSFRDYGQEARNDVGFRIARFVE